MVILTLNCGSSSLKYQVYNWESEEVLASGIVERIGIVGSIIEHRVGANVVSLEKECGNHREALKLVIDTLTHPEHGAIERLEDVGAVGHRVVHGGERFASSTLITGEVVDEFRRLTSLAPLHIPANLIGIESAQALLPQVPHCAIMDTAWHQTMPTSSYLYALPQEWYREHGIRRYGFHGTSFLYTAKRAAVLLGLDPFETRLVIAHIGNGSSINAVGEGVSVDTSMGLTPLEGLIMGTRSGDIDPAIPLHMMKSAGLSVEEMESILNKKSGVLGITEKWVDRRDIEIAAEEGVPEAVLAETMETYRIKKYIGAYVAALGGADAVVFTAGVGEMGTRVRQLATEGLGCMGIKLDPAKNELSKTRNAETVISEDGSPISVFVIPTNEELVMAEDTFALVDGSYEVHTNYSYRFQARGYVNRARIARLPKDLKKRPGLEGIIAHPK